MKFPAITVSVLIFSESLLLSVAKPKSPVNPKPTKQPVVKVAKKPAAPKGKSPTSPATPGNPVVSFDGTLTLAVVPQDSSEANTLAGKVKSALGQVLGASWTVKVNKVGDYDTSSVRRRLQGTTTVDYSATSNVTCTTDCGSQASTIIESAQTAVTESANNGTLTSNTGVAVSEPPKSWVLIGTVTGEPDENGYTAVKFGNGLSMRGDGSTVVVGATGGAYTQVLKYNSTSWNAVGPHITSGDYANAQFFGAPNAISADGKRVIVADCYGFSGNGYVRVYEFNGSSWVQLGTDLQGSSGSYFGDSVAMSSDGSKILAGAYYGYARMYQYVGSNWVQMGSDIKDTITNGGQGNLDDYFGNAVAMSADGSIIAIAAPQFSSSKGFVRVFRNQNSVFTPMGSDLVGDASSDLFGTKVALSEDGTKLAVCTGKSYQRIYSYNVATSLWDKMGSDIAESASSIALSALGTQVAFWNDNGDTNVYKFASSAWTKMGSVISGGANGQAFFPNVAMSQDGLTIAAGAGQFNGDVGQVLIYKWK